MPSSLIEITAVYRSERIRFGDDCAIVNVEEVKAEGQQAALDFEAEPSLLQVKLEAAPDELTPGLSYRFYGRWSVHPRHGKQFHAQTFIRVAPHGRAGVIRYLQQAPHVGKTTADLLWQKFQGDAVRILREQPAVTVAAVAAPHFTEEKAEQAARFLAGEAALESCTIDLIDIFDRRGFPKRIVKELIQEYGNKATETVKADPYLLMNYRGVGWDRADKLYLSLGHDPAAIRRQSLAAWHEINSDTEGSTWFTVQRAEIGIKKKVAGTNIDAPAALKAAKQSALLAFRRDDFNRLWVAERRNADQELAIAEKVAEIVSDSQRQPAEWPTLSEADDLSPHQVAEWTKATTGRIGLFTGGGGTGKTYTLARAVGRILGQCGHGSVALCAPTWAAANRMTESLAEYGIDLPATSIHSLLGVESASGGEWSFLHGASNPLRYRYIITDEGSMDDVPIMSCLLAAIPRDGHILIVGDTGQLAPVGHGAPMRDFIAAGLPTGELTEVRRNAGRLLEALSHIRHGRPFPVSSRVDLDAEPPENLKWFESGDPEQQIASILKVIEVARRAGHSLVWDVKTIVAVNEKSELSREKLNKVLQREVNKSGSRVGSNPFQVGDPVVKHGRREALKVDEKWQCDVPYKWESKEGYIVVTNREQGQVIEVSEKMTVVMVMRGRSPIFVRVPRGGGASQSGDDNCGDNGNVAGNSKSASTGCSWTLAYAITAHIGQGAQWPVVNVVVDDYFGAQMVGDRSWIYTSASRAMKLCCVHGKWATALKMMRTVKIEKRKTFLTSLIAEKIKEYQAGRELIAIEGQVEGAEGAVDSAFQALTTEVEEIAHASHR